jgi:FtsH-binding integral membrane protein
MPGCQYFIANTFAHLLGGLLVTGISTENPIINNIEKKPLSHLTMIILTFFFLFSVLSVKKGPLKYILFMLFCITIGQMLSGFVKKLKLEDVLSNTLLTVGAIFLSMTTIALFDKGNMLGWEAYLFAGLLGLILASIATMFMSKETKEANNVNMWISRFVVLLFTLYIGFDVEVMKVNATLCKSNPDYINESINLYLDIINLFSGVGGLND